MSETLRTTRFRVEGMDCAGCALKVERATRRIDGVEDVSVSVTAESMSVTHGAGLDLEAIARTVSSLGYHARLDGSAPIASHGTRTVESGDVAGSHGAGPDPRSGRVEDQPPPRTASTTSGTNASESEATTADAGLHGHAHDHGPADGAWWASKKAKLTLASGAALVIAYGTGLMVPAVGPWLFLAALLVGLMPVARRAVVAARLGSPFSIEMLMTIAAVGAVAIGAAEEAAAVVFLFLVGELLEGVAASRARASIRGLAALVPKVARVERGGAVSEVPAQDLLIGDVILARPGDRIAADGEIVEGTSAVDEAPVTGESVPKTKDPGSSVFAGTVNGEGLLRIRVTATSEDNTIARVIRLVEEAQESKAPTERFIDRFSRFYTPAVMAVAVLVAILPPLVSGGTWGEWVYKGLAILLIGCPCALVISTPAAIAAGLSAGARRGLLMKGGVVLERLGGLTAVAIDKTGTLTEGKPKVTDVIAFPNATGERAVVTLAAALESGSSHPLALAILARASSDDVAVPSATEVRALPGKGVEGRVGGSRVFVGSLAAAEEIGDVTQGQRAVIAGRMAEGKSVSVVLKDGRVTGIIALRDEPREDAKRGLEALKTAGVRPVMLTGDNDRTAAAVAASLGIEHRAELLPEDKQRIVRELQVSGHTVGKVGDGINDAPALAAADIGIAMGGGTDVALETADAAVLNGRVADIAAMIQLSRATMANIRQNIALALGLKAVFLVTTIAGITGLWPAILADTGATVLVTANAMRLLAWQSR